MPLGTVISWLFAIPKDGSKNGFGLTGGVLNYSAEVFYPDTGEKTSIHYQFNVGKRTVKQWLTTTIKIIRVWMSLTTLRHMSTSMGISQ